MQNVYKVAVVEMFKRVGLLYSYEDCLSYSKSHGESWYTTKYWTKEEEEDFRLWMLKKFKKFGKGLYTDSFYEKQVGMFLLDVGWTTNE